jgi:CheY-like chemotaxis protein
MLLPVLDALLLALIVASACALIASDLWTYWKLRSRRELKTPALQSPLRPPALPRRPALPKVADVLVVDDSAVARAKLRRLFVGAGYNVHVAQDGVQALALLGAGQYTLMVTDLEMPNMDGIALINACTRQAETARMPVIAVSGHENLRARFNECRKVCGVHPKPWFDDVLLSHVAALIGARTQPNPTGPRIPQAA